MEHQAQIERIKIKLKSARKADKHYKVFGASSHKYKLDVPVSVSNVERFEEEYNVILPSCYRAFITSVGNGGPGYQGSAAGPYYGIYPLGKYLDEIVEESHGALSRLAVITPDMTDTQWEAMGQRLFDSEDMCDEEYEAALATLYAGIMPLGSQGCTHLHGLVLNGPYIGRVVNLSMDYREGKPCFAYETNFLDWYGRWLDEIIRGDLLQDGVNWFGFTMGGDDSELMVAFREAGSDEKRCEILRGLGKLQSATDETCQHLLELCEADCSEIRHLGLQLLTKFDFDLALPHVRKHIAGDELDCLAACQGVNWYAKERAFELEQVLLDRLPSIDSEEPFRFTLYLLAETKTDFSDLLAAFIRHPDDQIRVTTCYQLASFNNKEAVAELLVEALADSSPHVVRQALQALPRKRNEALYQPLEDVLQRFRPEEEYIHTNVGHVLKTQGFSSIEKFLGRKQLHSAREQDQSRSRSLNHKRRWWPIRWR